MLCICAKFANFLFYLIFIFGWSEKSKTSIKWFSRQKILIWLFEITFPFKIYFKFEHYKNLNKTQKNWANGFSFVQMKRFGFFSIQNTFFFNFVVPWKIKKYLLQIITTWKLFSIFWYSKWPEKLIIHANHTWLWQTRQGNDIVRDKNDMG